MHWLGGSSRLGSGSLGIVALAIHEGVPTCSSLDLAKPIQITALEIATAMLELPESTIWIASMEDISLCKSYVRTERHNSRVMGLLILEHEPLWKPYMLSCRTKEDIFVCLKYCLPTGEISHLDCKSIK